ncbi:MAG TPA: dihydroneopterin aldolase [Gaiellaceae bacterium]|nr:dihydroneopterin aldolase [Gaiellaceae bacterium]
MRALPVQPPEMAGRHVTIELVGLEVFGRHGVDEDEREQGRPFFYDIELDVEQPGADRVEETVDYRAVAACVEEVSDGAQFRLIELLASAVADELAARFPARRVRVRVRKPGISPAGLSVAYSAATAEREN